MRKITNCARMYGNVWECTHKLTTNDELVANMTNRSLIPKEAVSKQVFWGIPRNDFLVARTLRNHWGGDGAGDIFLNPFQSVVLQVWVGGKRYGEECKALASEDSAREQLDCVKSRLQRP